MSDDQVDDVDDGALFGLPELTAGGKPGSVEAGCFRALQAGVAAYVVGDIDAGLAAAALATARRLDEADRLGQRFGDLKAGYLYAQLVGPFRELMQALRLPAEVEPADVPSTPTPAGGGSDAPSWLSDHFGTPQ